MKRILSLSLAVLMLLTTFAVFSTSVFAQDGETPVPTGQIWEGETDLLATDYVKSNEGLVYGQGVPGYNTTAGSEKPSWNSHMMWNKGSAGDSIEFPLDVKTEGKKTFVLQYLVAVDFGTFDVYWDDTLIYDNLDMYAAKANRKFIELELGEFEVTKGIHKLKFVVVGKNASSTGTILSIDFFELVGEDGVRRFVNVDNGNDDYGVITRFEDGTIRYEVEGMEKSVTTQAAIKADEDPYKVTTQGFNGAWDVEVPMGYFAHVHWETAEEGQEISFRFFVEEAGEYELNFHGLTAKNYGIMEVQIDGATLATVNQYTPTVRSAQFTPEKTVMLKTGYHTLTMVQIGKSGDSTGTHQSLDFMEIKKVSSFVTTGQIWEGETDIMREKITVKAGQNVRGQDISGYNNDKKSLVKPSNDAHAMWYPAAVGDALEITLDVKVTDIKTMYFQYLKAVDFGIFDIYWDGELIGDNIDMFAAKTDEDPRRLEEICLGKFDIAPGKHTLKFVLVGQNARSTGKLFSFDYFELVGEDGIRRTQKIDKRGSDWGVIYYYDDGTIRYEAEAMKISEATQALIDNGTYKKEASQAAGNWHMAYLSSNDHLRLSFNDSSVGSEFSVEFKVDKTAYYSIELGNITAKEWRIVQYKIDGQFVGDEIDTYTASVGSQVTTLSNVFRLEEGYHTLTIVYKGDNPSAHATKKILSVDYIDIRDISLGMTFEYNPDVTPATGDAMAYIMLALAVSVTALALPAILSFRKQKNSK